MQGSGGCRKTIREVLGMVANGGVHPDGVAVRLLWKMMSRMVWGVVRCVERWGGRCTGRGSGAREMDMKRTARRLGQGVLRSGRRRGRVRP